jgi:hypothetical protein
MQPCGTRRGVVAITAAGAPSFFRASSGARLLDRGAEPRLPSPAYDSLLMSTEFDTTLHDLQDKFAHERRSARKAIVLTIAAMVAGTAFVVLVKLYA